MSARSLTMTRAPQLSRERSDRGGRLEESAAPGIDLRAQLQEARAAVEEGVRQIDQRPARARGGVGVDDRAEGAGISSTGGGIKGSGDQEVRRTQDSGVQAS